MFLDLFRKKVDKERIPLLEDGPERVENFLRPPITFPATKRKATLGDIWPQVIASQISLSTSIQVGISLAFSGVLIPQLSSDPNIKNNITEVEASWIASLVIISQPLGSLLVGPAMDTFGRKNTCIFQNIPTILSWVIIYFTVESLWPIYIARLLAGVGAGFSLVGLVYTAEISEKTFRATLLSTNSINVSLGVLITTVAGVYLDWHRCAFLFGHLSLASLLLAIVLPESPYWLASFTNTSQTEIKAVLNKLNKNRDICIAEWQRIQKSVLKKRSHLGTEGRKKNWCKKFQDTCCRFKERTSYMPLILLLILFLLQQTSGTYVVIFYTLSIFESIGENYGPGFNKYSATIAVGVMKFVLSCIATGISKPLGRRPILIISAAGMAVTAAVTAVLLEINDIDTINFSSDNAPKTIDVEGRPVSDHWIVLSILLYVSSAAIGIMVIPWTLVSELLPTKVRGFGSGLLLSYGAALMFFVIKTFPFIVNQISLATVFFSYAVMSFLSGLFIYLFLPETHGKTFSEIEDYFDSSSSN